VRESVCEREREKIRNTVNRKREREREKKLFKNMKIVRKFKK